jgi:hypothetical protein
MEEWMRSSTGTVRLAVRFKNPQSARPCLARIAAIPGLLLNILRGRVTAHRAEFQLELSGHDTCVCQAVTSLRAEASRL